jgi:hypothetical protein
LISLLLSDFQRFQPGEMRSLDSDILTSWENG